MPDELRPYLMCHSYPSIFSSCLLPHEVAGLAATLQVVRASDDARARLRANTLRRLHRAHAPIAERLPDRTTAASRSSRLEAGLEADTLALRGPARSERGVFGAVFCAPATSRNRAMVRLTLNASLTDAEMSHVEHRGRAKSRRWSSPGTGRSPGANARRRRPERNRTAGQRTQRLRRGERSKRRLTRKSFTFP